MKHCHFSILCNELPFLKQKLPFLYKYFDQLIFYDLDVAKRSISNDGSNQYIRNYPDPDQKITVLQGMEPLKSITKYHGQSLIEKRKMFAVGSQYVRKDMDVFWCTDMDEFFKAELIREVEVQFKNHPNENIINIPHLLFFKNLHTAMINLNHKHPKGYFLFKHAPRIVRHKPGRIYGHCPALGGPQHWILNHCLYHFTYVGLPRIVQKLIWRGTDKRYKETIPKGRKYLREKYFAYKGGEMKGVHPEGIKVVTQEWDIEDLPEYISRKDLLSELDHTNDSHLVRQAKRYFDLDLHNVRSLE